MALPDTTVKIFDSTMLNAVQLTGEVGKLVDVFDSCLLPGGFGSVSVTSLAVNGNIATVVTSVDHGLAMFGNVGPVVVFSGTTVTGADPDYLNAEFRVASIPTSTSFTFLTEGLGNQTATGTITVSRAGLGWEKPYSGTNKAVYTPKFPYNKGYIRILDDSTVPVSSAGRWAKVRAYETMNGIDTGTGEAPTVAQSPNGISILKSDGSNSTTRKWILIGDSGIFYFFTMWHSSYVNELLYPWGGWVFGECGSFRPGDQYNFIVGGESMTVDSLPNGQAQYNYFSYSTPSALALSGKSILRSSSQLGSADYANFYSPFVVSAGWFGFTINALSYPWGVNGGAFIYPVMLYDSISYRSPHVPGLYAPLHNAPYNTRVIVENSIDTFYCIVTATDVSVNTRGNMLFDLKGPWR